MTKLDKLVYIYTTIRKWEKVIFDTKVRSSNHVMVRRGGEYVLVKKEFNKLAKLTYKGWECHFEMFQMLLKQFEQEANKFSLKGRKQVAQFLDLQGSLYFSKGKWHLRRG